MTKKAKYWHENMCGPVEKKRRSIKNGHFWLSNVIYKAVKKYTGEKVPHSTNSADNLDRQIQKNKIKSVSPTYHTQKQTKMDQKPQFKTCYGKIN